MKRILAALCLGLGLASPAVAEDSPFCGMAGPEHWEEVRDSFIGVWTMEHLAGYVTAGGMTMPFPASPEVETVSIALFGDELVAVHPDSDEPLLLTLADEPRWVVDSDNPAVPEVPVSPDDAAFIYGCEQMEIPRILGTATINLQGMTMDFTYRMMALSMNQMYGIMRVTGVAQGHPYTAHRTVWMNRAG